MLYTIEFTRAHYARRRRLALFLALVLAVLLGMAGVAARMAYVEYTKPPLAERLATYHAAALKVEDVAAAWTNCQSHYSQIAPYYRIFWCENGLDVLACLSDEHALLPRELVPVSWQLRSPGVSELVYSLRFEPELSKIEQIADATNRLAAALAQWQPAVTCETGDLADLDALRISVAFRLHSPPRESMPQIPSNIVSVVKDIDARRGICLDYAPPEWAGDMTTVKAAMDRVLSDTLPPLKGRRVDTAALEEGRRRAIDPGTFFEAAGAALRAAGIRVEPQALIDARARWSELANRRLRRARALDNAALDNERDRLDGILASGLPSPGVFKAVEQRTVELRAALTNGYSERAVFDEGHAKQGLVKAVGSVSNNLDVAADVKRRPAVNGLILVPWTVTLTPSQNATVASPESVRTIVAGVQALLLAPGGFVIESIDIRFESKVGDGQPRVVQGALAGLVPCRTESGAKSPVAKGGR